MPLARAGCFCRVDGCLGLLQRGLFDWKENGTAKHAKHAKGCGVLLGQDYALALKARVAEVEQQAEIQGCRFWEVQALRAVNIVDRLGCLQIGEDDWTAPLV